MPQHNPMWLSSPRAKSQGGSSSRASARLRRENGALAFAESAKPGNFFVSDHVRLSAEKLTLLDVANDIVFCEADEAVAADHACLLGLL